MLTVLKILYSNAGGYISHIQILRWRQCQCTTIYPMEFAHPDIGCVIPGPCRCGTACQGSIVGERGSALIQSDIFSCSSQTAAWSNNGDLLSYTKEDNYQEDDIELPRDRICISQPGLVLAQPELILLTVFGFALFYLLGELSS